MNENQIMVLEKQKRRYQFLLALWKQAEGKESKIINLMQVARDEDFEEEEAAEYWHYFDGEGLFGNLAYQWGISLSHKAILEIEKSLTNPLQSTEHFSTTVIQNFNASVGAVQNGNNNVANVNQNIG